MRILVHDFAGQPYEIQLSRNLARRGHEVLHTYCGSLQTTPRGTLTPRPDDPPGLKIEALTLDRPLEKFSFLTRWLQENAYGRLLVEAVERFQPDVVLSANTPLDAQRRLLRRTRQDGIRFVFWVQDLIGIAAARILKKKIPLLGSLIGGYYARLERNLIRQSDSVVLITEDFRPIMQDWDVKEDAIYVIENWAPLDEMPLRRPDNAWARSHDLVDKRCLIYAGTLGMKHNPDLLLQLALRLREMEDVRVVVLSQGLGADWLKQEKEKHGVENLILLGFEPFDQMPDVLATSDVLVAILESDAGVFSVPSKVLAYLCGARPILLSIPPENLAGRIVSRENAGRVVPPAETDAFVEAAFELLQNDALRAELGRNARHYAEEAFDIERITDAFEAALRAG